MLACMHPDSQRRTAHGLTYAMVKPAKTPPARTSAMAMPRYRTRLASLLGCASSASAWVRPAKGRGSALTMGAKAWKTKTSSILTRAVPGDEKPLAAPGRERAALMAEAIAVVSTRVRGDEEYPSDGC